MKGGYVQEQKETGLRSRTQQKLNTRLTKKRNTEPYTRDHRQLHSISLLLLK
jgi:hypothetical protein